MAREGELTSKVGLLSVERGDKGLVMRSFLNNFEIENYFLKAMSLGRFTEYQVLNGAAVSVDKTTSAGDKRKASRTQQYHCNANRLCLPFVHFGLGKINHYVENFEVRIPRTHDNGHSWTTIIPNSQLMVFWNPDESPQWKISIFINPTSAMWFIFVSTCVILLVLLMLILYLHFKEKNNDVEFVIGPEGKL